ncbi:unnamed protein product [Oppiella nova]|uniref:C2H2-type domain-containing protein n=1 Tax=Oppiella nova TaxID=334625 RepID=A0A7R9QFS5_9ACAR|nr:unnamed protein product [Oppiella nova]CAG2165032.1 unnamed protein product [Oppiella nova]
MTTYRSLPMTPALSTGCLQQIIKTKANVTSGGDSHQQPIVQILGTKRVANGSIRVILYDGVHTLKTAVIKKSPENDAKFDGKQMENFSIVQLVHYWSVQNNQNLNNTVNAGIDTSKVCPIAAITPFFNGWLIRARITSKIPVRTYTTKDGREGKVFSFDATDHSSDIRVTAFNAECDKYHDIIEKDMNYLIQKGTVKTANRKFSNCKSDYEIMLTSESVIELCQDDVPLPPVSYRFRQIGQLVDDPVGVSVDVCAVIRVVDECQKIVAKKDQKEYQKRDVTLVDKSLAEVRLTLWRREAEEFAGCTGQVMAIKNAIVGDFRGRTLSCAPNAIIEEAVVLVPEMSAEEKLKAVQFWNVVSERLQEIVNNSAADINALAMRLEQEDHHPQGQPPPLQQSISQPIPQQPLQNHQQPSQSSAVLMDSNSMCGQTMTTDGSSSGDNHEIYLPIDHRNHQTISDNSMISNHMSSSHEFQPSVVTTAEDVDEVIGEHLASVITTYSNNNGADKASQQLLIALAKHPEESQDMFAEQLEMSDDRHRPSQQPSMATTTSVIQELDQNVLITSQRRNVIQSTQKAIEAIEKNLQNCCHEFETKTRESFGSGGDNRLHESSSDNTGSNLIKTIETIDETRGESSGETVGSVNHVFNDTSFDVNSLDGSSVSAAEDTDQNSRPKYSIDETVNTDNSQESVVNELTISEKKSQKKSLSPKKRCKMGANKSLKSLKNKDNKSSSDGNYSCDICHKVLPNESALVTHKWIHSKPYSCSECEARFSTKGNLLVHQRRHTGEKPFQCDRCPASFSTKGNLKRHIKAHSGERPWKCSQCESRFTEKKSLKVHMRRHTGEKPYQCSVCGKSFSQTGVLQTHMALHLDERKHLCELCGKAFRQRSQLRLHVLRHEGVKRWDCTDCEAKFLTKGDLERHHRVHTGERPFVCDLCGKTFTRQQSLNEHSNRHYGLKPYACTVCSKTFAEMSACYKHIKVHKKQQTINKNTGNESIIKTSMAKEVAISNRRVLTANETKANVPTTRSQINVIQSTATSGHHKAAPKTYFKSTTDGHINSNISGDSINTSASNSNNNIMITNSNDSVEYVDFGAINLLANTSTQ